METVTCESLGELEKAVETLACGLCSHSISRSPKLPLVFLFNKLTSVFHASVLLLIMNFVITLSKKLWIREAIAEWNTRLLWQCYRRIFIVNNKTDALKSDINLFFTITNCQIVCSRSLTHRINYKSMCMSVRLLAIKISQSAREISAVIVKISIETRCMFSTSRY